MPNYINRVTYEYPVSAVDAKDAFSTLPLVIKIKYINGHVKGQAEVIDAKTKKVMLKAELNTEKNKV